MADAIVCPACGKRFAFKPSLIGRRVNCPGCRHPFVVREPAASQAPPIGLPRIPSRTAPQASNPPMVADAFEVVEDEPIATAPLPRGEQSGAAPIVAPLAYQRSTSASAEWTDGQKLALKTGTSLIVFGIAALILPLFGLQFRKLQAAGDNAPAVAIGLIILGAVIDIAALAMRRLKWALMVVGGAIVGLVLLVVVLAFGLGRARRPAFTPPPPMPFPQSPGAWSSAPRRSTPQPPAGSAPSPGTPSVIPPVASTDAPASEPAIASRSADPAASAPPSESTPTRVVPAPQAAGQDLTPALPTGATPTPAAPAPQATGGDSTPAPPTTATPTALAPGLQNIGGDLTPAQRSAQARHDSLVRRFGAENVATVKVIMPDPKAAMNGKFRLELIAICKSVGAKSALPGPSDGNVIHCETAPISDLDALAKAMTFGHAVVDKATRTITVTCK